MDQVSCYICWDDHHGCRPGSWVFYIPEYQLFNLYHYKHTYEDIRNEHRKITHVYLSRRIIDSWLQRDHYEEEHLPLWDEIHEWMRSQTGHSIWEKTQRNNQVCFVLSLVGYGIFFGVGVWSCFG